MALKKGGEVATKNGIAELAKRVPPNQLLSFKDFQAKHAEYLARVNKQPEKLPNIDWEYYQRNVRAEFVKMIQEFEQKYKGVCEAYDKRGQQDKSKYFVEIDKLRQQVQAEVDQYKAESNKRIKALEAKYASVKALKPYEQMTAEEYSELLPEKSFFIYEGHPSFWPHTPDEQGPGPSVKDAHGHGHDDHGGGEDGHGGGKGGGSGGDAGAKSAAPAEPEKSDSKSNEKKSEKSANAAASIQKTTSVFQSNAAKTEACFESEQFSSDLDKFRKCFEEETKTIASKSSNDGKTVQLVKIEEILPTKVTFNSPVVPLQANTDDIYVIEPINLEKNSDKKEMPTVTFFQASNTEKVTEINSELSHFNVLPPQPQQLKPEINDLVKSTIEAFQKLAEAESAGIVIPKDDESSWMNQFNLISTTPKAANQRINTSINEKSSHTETKDAASNKMPQFNTINKDELMQILNEMSEESTKNKTESPSGELVNNTVIDELKKVDTIKPAGISNLQIENAAEPRLPKTSSMNLATSGIATQKSAPTVVSSFRSESTQATNVPPEATQLKQEMDKLIKSTVEAFKQLSKAESDGIISSQAESAAVYLKDDEPLLMKTASMMAVQKDTEVLISAFGSELDENPISLESDQLKQDMTNLAKSTVEAFALIAKAKSDGFISSQAESAAVYLKDDEPLLIKNEIKAPNIFSSQSDQFQQEMFNLMKTTVETFAQFAEAESNRQIVNSNKTGEKSTLKDPKKGT